MLWPRDIYQVAYGPWTYRVGDAVLLARDGFATGRGRFLYRGAPIQYFVVDMSTDPPLCRIGPGLDPYQLFEELPVHYLPPRVAVWPDSWYPGPDREIKALVPFLGSEYVDQLERQPRGLELTEIPPLGVDLRALPEGALEAVVDGKYYRVREAELLALGPAGNLYRTRTGEYFATGRTVTWEPYLEVLSPVTARIRFYEWAPAVTYEAAFADADFGPIREDDGWRVPPLVRVPEPPGLRARLPDFVLYGRAYSPRECRLLAWRASQLGTGERILELLVETPDGEFGEVIWAGGQDVRVLPRSALDVRYSYERLLAKVAAPEEVYGAATV